MVDRRRKPWDDAVAAIRNEPAIRGYIAKLARRFGVSHSAIRFARRGWTHKRVRA